MSDHKIVGVATQGEDESSRFYVKYYTIATQKDGEENWNVVTDDEEHTLVSMFVSYLFE